MKLFLFLALTIPLGSLLAQDTSSGSSAPGNTAPPLLQRPYEAARDFFNFFAFANGVYDSNAAYLGSSNRGGGVGTQIGGGASGYHQFATGSLSLDYRGDYRHYNTAGFGDGTDQNLAFYFQKLGKRWSFTAGETAGIFYEGGTIYGTDASLVQSSPLSSETRFAGTTLSMSYQQSLRLSYQVTGSYFLNRYTGYRSIGSNDFVGSFSPIYRLTRRTTVSGTYSHSRYLYQHNGGVSDADSVYLTLGHDFASRWHVSVSGGMTRATSSGSILIPVFLQQNQQLIPVFLTGHYNQTTTLPYYQGAVTRLLRHSSISASGGESVGPGNGYFLASRTHNINGYWIYNLRRSTLNGGAYFARLSSVSNAVTATESSTGLNAAYAYNIIRHVGVNVRYDYIKYGNLGNLKVPSDNRISVGVYFTSKDIPLGSH